VPDLRGRVPVGVDPNDSQLNTLGKQDGEKAHKLTVNEMPNHDHGLYGNSVLWGQSSQNVQFVVGGSYVQATVTGTSGNGVGTNQHRWNKTSDQGGGAAHNNMQPYILLNYIIRSL
jgi:microcystin-dependent protein